MRVQLSGCWGCERGHGGRARGRKGTGLEWTGAGLPEDQVSAQSGGRGPRGQRWHLPGESGVGEGEGWGALPPRSPLHLQHRAEDKPPGKAGTAGACVLVGTDCKCSPKPGTGSGLFFGPKEPAVLGSDRTFFPEALPPSLELTFRPSESALTHPSAPTF